MQNSSIYGSGMIAKALSEFPIANDVVIIAAGVSNSRESRESEFLREHKLLESILNKHQDKRVIYFSSCSIYQSESSPYIRHKQQMEDVIAQLSSCYQIFRLPQVVGNTTNNTIISHFTKCIINKLPLKAYKNATRQIIDVKDVGRIMAELINSNLYLNSIVNISNGVKIPVLDIIQKISLIIGEQPEVKIVDAGESYNIPIVKLKKFLSPQDSIFSDDYTDVVLQRYVPRIASMGIQH